LEGGDPQLERTIKVLQEEMKNYKYPNVARPKDPVRGHEGLHEGNLTSVYQKIGLTKPSLY
jgi:hypothetical protein